MRLQIDLLVEYLIKVFRKTDRLKRVKFELETDLGPSVCR